MNKGYTLVEVLGVIIILILLTALVLPNVINSIKSSTNKSDELMEDIIISSAKLYMSDNYSDMKIDNGFTYCISLSTLVKNGYLETPIKYNNMDDVTGIKSVKVTYTNKYTYSIVDKNACSYIVLQDIGSTEFLGTDLLKTSIESITFVNNLNIHNNSLKEFDISDSNNGSIMLWYTDSNSNNLYEVYIGSDTSVVANSSSNNLFSGLTNVTSINMNYLDTSKIIDASNMFSNTPNLNEIIMNTCDFSKVKVSDDMFKNTKTGITIRINNNSNTFITDNLTSSEVENPNVIIVN